MLKKTPPLRDIEEAFSLFDDWEDRYRYLIDLGRHIETMAEAEKTENNLVRGCTSRVWMIIEVIDGRLSFCADSNSDIVRGLIGLLDAVYQGKSRAEISAIDIEAIFSGLGLQNNLSPNRRSGFYAMVERIRATAA